jgi:hypothetical protein
MALWRKRHADRPTPPAPDPAAVQELREAGRRQAAATASSWRRAPVYAEAERLRRANNFYDDLMRALDRKGSST